MSRSELRKSQGRTKVEPRSELRKVKDRPKADPRPELRKSQKVRAEDNLRTDLKKGRGQS
jgi:hypothetical protein